MNWSNSNHSTPKYESIASILKKYKIEYPLGFGQQIAPIMTSATYKDGRWSDAELSPLRSIDLPLSAKVLHYGQQIFEGMKAYSHPHKTPVLFRPDLHFARFNRSASRMAMPQLPQSVFDDSLKVLVTALKNFIPNKIGESLYLRPMMIATDCGLGLKSSESFFYAVIASPSAAYFSPGEVHALIERKDARAAIGGTGAYKVGGNYGSSIRSSITANELNFQQTLWLDGVEHRCIEEFSGMNFFAVIDNQIYTPSLSETILPGVTRQSIIELAPVLGLQVKETKIDISHLTAAIENQSCSEIFATGTAAVVSSIHALGESSGKRYHLPSSGFPIAKKIYQSLIDLQYQYVPDHMGWLSPIDIKRVKEKESVQSG